MDHISGNKSPVESKEIPFDREYPEDEPVKFPRIAIYFYGWAGLQSEKMPKRGTKGSRYEG